MRSVADSIRQFGDRYLGRVFTADERDYCAGIGSRGGDSVPHFAARFAAKEAVMKVLRPSASDGVAWSSIEILRDADGGCTVRLRGAARELARRARLGSFAVSMSHERDYATAVALAERAQSAPRPQRARDDGRRKRPRAGTTKRVQAQ